MSRRAVTISVLAVLLVASGDRPLRDWLRSRSLDPRLAIDAGGSPSARAIALRALRARAQREALAAGRFNYSFEVNTPIGLPHLPPLGQ